MGRAIVVFGRDGARIPTFRHRVVTVENSIIEVKMVGYRDLRDWYASYGAMRWDQRGWRLWMLAPEKYVAGSVMEGQLERSAKCAVFPIRRWPNLASIEMYLRMVRP